MTRRVGELLRKLPADINPVNLEELRRIKQALVELENKVGGRGPGTERDKTQEQIQRKCTHCMRSCMHRHDCKRARVATAPARSEAHQQPRMVVPPVRPRAPAPSQSPGGHAA